MAAMISNPLKKHSKALRYVEKLHFLPRFSRILFPMKPAVLSCTNMNTRSWPHVIATYYIAQLKTDEDAKMFWPQHLP